MPKLWKPRRGPNAPPGAVLNPNPNPGAPGVGVCAKHAGTRSHLVPSKSEFPSGERLSLVLDSHSVTTACSGRCLGERCDRGSANKVTVLPKQLLKLILFPVPTDSLFAPLHV